jgi:hypothetical protein
MKRKNEKSGPAFPKRPEILGHVLLLSLAFSLFSCRAARSSVVFFAKLFRGYLILSSTSDMCILSAGVGAGCRIFVGVISIITICVA